MAQSRTVCSPGDAIAPIAATPVNRVERDDSSDQWVYHDESILRQFSEVAASSNLQSSPLSAVASIVVKQSPCLGLWIIPAVDDGIGQPQSMLSADDTVLWSLIAAPSQALVGRISQSGDVASTTLSQPGVIHLVAAPLGSAASGKSGQAAIVGCFDGNQQSPVRLQWLLGLAAWTIHRAQQSLHCSQLIANQHSTERTLSLLAAADESNSLPAAAITVANLLAAQFQADQVAVAIGVTPRQTRLQAISGVEKIQPNAGGTRACLAACQQTIRHATPRRWSVGDKPGTAIELVLDNYCREFQWSGCLAVPFSEAEDAGGCLLIALPADTIADEVRCVEMIRLASHVGRHFRSIARRHQTVLQRFQQRWKCFKTRQILFVTAMVAVVLAIAAWIPMPYRIACEGQLEPVTRRFVAAPYDGMLEASFVKVGDTVTPGQPLAQLDGHPLRLELSSLEAEYDSAKKRRDAALASRQVAQSQLASSEMLRHLASIGLVQDRLDHLQVCAPVAGMVVSGDLEKANGAPLEVGQTLFEIAPLEQMVAEIRIPEQEIPYVKPGMPIAIKLNALPFDTWSGTIGRIHPQAEIIDGNSVFVAEVQLDNPDGMLHPGMQVTSKVQGQHATIGWILTHRPWEAVRYWWAW